MVTAAKNTDGSVAVVVFNEGEEARSFDLELDGQIASIAIEAQALQTIFIQSKSE
jgi:glucosylceramidase